MKIHIVQRGETIWDIAEKHGVDFTEVVELNPQISSPDMIMPGMKIKIPVSAKQVKEEQITKEKQTKQAKKESVKESEKKKEEKQAQEPKPMKEQKTEPKETDLLEKSMPPSFALPEMPVLPEGKQFMGEEVKQKETTKEKKSAPFATDKKETQEKKVEMEAQMPPFPQASMPPPMGVPFPGGMENQMQPPPQSSWSQVPMMPCCCCCQMRSQIYAPQMMYGPPVEPWGPARFGGGGMQARDQAGIPQDYQRQMEQVSYPQAQQGDGWSPHMRTMQNEATGSEREEAQEAQASMMSQPTESFREQDAFMPLPPAYPLYGDDPENES